MKKLVMMAAVACLGLAAQASLSVTWRASGVYDSNGLDKYSGPATLYLTITGNDQVTYTQTAEANMSNGKINATSSFTDAPSAGTYSAYYTMTSTYKGNEMVFTSGTRTGSFSGNFTIVFTSTGDWQDGAVPEPTSGVLLLVGLAGLALKRKRA